MAKEQDGNLADALADYKALLAEAPADAATWREPLKMRIEEVSPVSPAQASPRPPTLAPPPADMAAAAKLAPEQHSQMIAQMVDGLAQRLKRNGRDLPGWLRLLNAYAVLDRKDDARAALAEARRNFGERRWRARRAFQDLGLGSEEQHSVGAHDPQAAPRDLHRPRRRHPVACRVPRALCAARHHRLLSHAQGRRGKADPGRQAHPSRRPRRRRQLEARRGTTVEFAITDTAKTIPVSYTGILPDLFREGQGVVAEGKLDPAGRFLADTVLAKHDENYMPPEVAKALKEQGVWHDAKPKSAVPK